MWVKNPYLRMLCGSFYIPKGNPSKPAGEDAHFYCEKWQVIGVADGVGGCADRGIDAGEYARQLMTNAYDAVKSCRPLNVNPSQVLKDAHGKTKVEGSSTACIITMCGDGLLFAANLGDSGFMVIREGRMCYRSPVRQHRFNKPYQMGRISGDGPGAAEKIAFGLRRRDVIVAGTDGLFDNLFQADIEAIVEYCLEGEHLPATVAETLASAARENSVKNIVTPFEMAANEAGFKHFGGKKDDITVVVAYVVERLPVEEDAWTVSSEDENCYCADLSKACFSGILSDWMVF